ncbi:hypothetical protein NUU61_010177 [Penicillium alfredii]|uniref:NmrA-like domain-containing protein n=1 Tax=Penicillium alfredii TaxID=1506179 RepID=A0A9W9JUA7_9EURO|nr:uncharacterized protein NUU61_010177 [Penicillium alfredii]KAJ5081913.1 hypothetical protein NUU61_010177 [Penicillium alfredii]
MSKLLVVFGATGQQGGSVIDYVLNDPVLSKEYSLRAITRNASRPDAQELQSRGVEVVAADADSPETLPAALANAHTVFLVTVSIYDDQLKPREYRQAKAVADEAVAAGAKSIIFSSCVAAERLHGRPVPAFDSKADAEVYIRTLPIHSAFFAPGNFMQNFFGNQAPRLLPGEEGSEPTYAITNFLEPDTAVPLVNTVGDTGKYVGAILANPEQYNGKIFYAASGLYKYSQIAEILTRITGNKTIYNQISQEQWTSFMPEGYRESIVPMMQFIQNPGYFGPNSKESVEWTVQQARGKVTSFEEFVEKNAEALYKQ